jgi:hypothetical protein
MDLAWATADIPIPSALPTNPVGWVVVAWTPSFDGNGNPISQTFAGYVLNGAGDAAPGVWHTIDRAVAALGVETIYWQEYQPTLSVIFSVVYSDGSKMLNPTFGLMPGLPSTWPFVIKNQAGDFDIWPQLPWATMPADPGVVIGPITPVGTVVTITNNGSDLGPQITAADASLGASTGTILVQGRYAGDVGLIATKVVISSNHTLMIGPNFTIQNQINDQMGNILLKDYASLVGYDWTSIMQESTYFGTQPTPIVAAYNASPFTDPNITNQCTSISVQNIQFSGVGQYFPFNVSQSSLMTCQLNGGTWKGIWLNTTHAIGLAVGGNKDNAGQPAVCQNLTVGANLYTMVGGAFPPSTGAGGVAFAIIAGASITASNQVFVDCLGNGAVDLEPNSQYVAMSNLILSGHIISYGNTTGIFSKFNAGQNYYYGFTTHGDIGMGSAWGPITMQYNIVAGGRSGATPIGACYIGFYSGYGAVTHSETITENLVRYSNYWPIVVSGHDNTISNNDCFSCYNNILVSGHGNMVSGNKNLTTVAQGTSFGLGVEERNKDPFIGYPYPQASTVGGSLATGTVYIVVTWVDASGNESDWLLEYAVPVTGPTASIALQWPTIAANGELYRVYVGTTPGGENAYFTVAAGGAPPFGTTSFTVTTLSGTAGTPPSWTHQSASTSIDSYSNTFTNNTGTGIGRLKDEWYSPPINEAVYLSSTHSSKSGDAVVPRVTLP